MRTDGLILSFETFGSLSISCQAEILKALGVERPLSEDAETASGDSTSATKFTVNQMREFLDGVGDKTRTVLEGVAAQPYRFNVGELLDRLGMQYADLRGVLAGLTKRSRTIAGDDEASFFATVVWEDDMRKCVSEVHPVTHAALKKLLKVD